MKTKTLLIAAATLAVGVIASQAAVYSANVVGYVNIPLTNGYNSVTVPVDYDGTGTNNLVTAIIGTNLPTGSSILTWSTAGVGYTTANTFAPTSKNTTPHWSAPTAIYNPGQGLFIQITNPTATVTFVGTVLQGGLTNGYLTQAGYSLIGGQFPVQGGITTTYGYKPSNGDNFQAWSATAQGFLTANTYGPTSKNSTPHWSAAGGEPVLNVGQAAFIQTTNQHPVWGTNFVIPTP